jgi:hypothetical protein
MDPMAVRTVPSYLQHIVACARQCYQRDWHDSGPSASNQHQHTALTPPNDKVLHCLDQAALDVTCTWKSHGCTSELLDEVPSYSVHARSQAMGASC